MSDGQSVAAGTKGQQGGYGATKLARLLLAALMTACGSSSPPVGVDGAPLPPDLDASVVPPGPGQDADPMNPPSPWDAALGDTGGVVLAARRAQMLSVPPSFVLSNEEYSYMPKHSGAGDTEWRIVQAPPGLLVRERRLIAEANTLPAGAHTVVLEAQVGDTLVRQSYPLTVATPLQRAARLVTPTEPTQVVVQSETSLVRRAGVSLPVGAVSVDTNVSVNEVSRAPQRVGYRGAGPVVDFGPSGTVFRRRATVALPFDGQMNPGKTGAFTYNPHAGRWGEARGSAGRGRREQAGVRQGLSLLDVHGRRR
ncbi:MAG: hypothetical protein KA712_00305 [Myxococcales bacterium]|nr:hypothetical protein [Myxococcales bacterium]